MESRRSQSSVSSVAEKEVGEYHVCSMAQENSARMAGVSSEDNASEEERFSELSKEACILRKKVKQRISTQENCNNSGNGISLIV